MLKFTIFLSEEVMEMAGDIYNTTMKIFELSRSQEIPTYLAANRMAEDKIEKRSRKKCLIEDTLE